MSGKNCRNEVQQKIGEKGEFIKDVGSVGDRDILVRIRMRNSEACNKNMRQGSERNVPDTLSEKKMK
jgi:hypothetical protein